MTIKLSPITEKLANQKLNELSSLDSKLSQDFLASFKPVPEDCQITTLSAQNNAGQLDVFGKVFGLTIETPDDHLFFTFLTVALKALDQSFHDFNQVVAVPSLTPGSPNYTGVRNKTGTIMIYGPKLTEMIFNNGQMMFVDDSNKPVTVEIVDCPSKKTLRDPKTFTFEIRSEELVVALVQAFRAGSTNPAIKKLIPYFVRPISATKKGSNPLLYCTQINFACFFNTDMSDIGIVQNALSNQNKVQNIKNSSLDTNKDKGYVRTALKKPKKGEVQLILGGSTAKEMAIFTPRLNLVLNKDKVVCEVSYFLQRKGAHQTFVQFIFDSSFDQADKFSALLASQLHAFLKRLTSTEFFLLFISALEKRRVNVFSQKRVIQGNTKERWLARAFSGIINYYAPTNTNDQLYYKYGSSNTSTAKNIEDQILAVEKIAELLPYINAGFVILANDPTKMTVTQSFFDLLNSLFIETNKTYAKFIAEQKTKHPLLTDAYSLLNDKGIKFEWAKYNEMNFPAIEDIAESLKKVLAKTNGDFRSSADLVKNISQLHYGKHHLTKTTWKNYNFPKDFDQTLDKALYILLEIYNHPSLDNFAKWATLKTNTNLQKLVQDVCSIANVDQPNFNDAKQPQAAAAAIQQIEAVAAQAATEEFTYRFSDSALQEGESEEGDESEEGESEEGESEENKTSTNVKSEQPLKKRRGRPRKTAEG